MSETERALGRPPVPTVNDHTLWWDGMGFHRARMVGPWEWRVDFARWGASVEFLDGPRAGMGEHFTSPKWSDRL